MGKTVWIRRSGETGEGNMVRFYARKKDAQDIDALYAYDGDYFFTACLSNFERFTGLKVPVGTVPVKIRMSAFLV